MAVSDQEELIRKGKCCIEAAKTAYEYLLQTSASSSTDRGRASPGTEEALNCLASFREDGRQLKEAAQCIKKELQERHKTLVQQLAAIDEKPHDHKEALTRLHHKRQQEETRLLKLQKSLEVSQNKLRAAEEQLRCAKSESRAKKESAAAAAMSSPVGVPGAMAGFGFGELVRAIVGYRQSSSSVGASVKAAERNVAIHGEDVKNIKRKIALTQKVLNSIHREVTDHNDTISTNENTKRSLLSKISSTESVVSFQSEVIEFWSLFIQASALESEHVQCLEKLVGWEEEVRKVKVLRSQGYTTEDLSFAETWEQVTFRHGLLHNQDT